MSHCEEGTWSLIGLLVLCLLRGYIDFLRFLGRLLEVPDPPPESFPDLREFVGAKDDQDNDKNDE